MAKLPKAIRPPKIPRSGNIEADVTFAALGAIVGGLVVTNQVLKVRKAKAVNRDIAVTVDAVRLETEDVLTVDFVRVDGSRFPKWQPGAHLDIYLQSGRRRQYSLCGDPADRKVWRIGVRRLEDGGGGSKEIHELTPGTQLVVRGPRNAFPLIAAPSYLFVAGGIGVTPILPMVQAAADSGADWQLVFSGRSRDSLPFLTELQSVNAERVHILTDDIDGIPSPERILSFAPAGAAIYCCGPAPMINALRQPAIDLTGSYYSERFSALPVVGGQDFEVELARSGEVLAIPADRSVLSVLMERDPAVAYSCQQGFCGVCRQRVVSGEVDHRDQTLTPAQRKDSMLTCVSRSKDQCRLVLDL